MPRLENEESRLAGGHASAILNHIEMFIKGLIGATKGRCLVALMLTGLSVYATPQETHMTNFTIRFLSKNFTIENAILLLYPNRPTMQDFRSNAPGASSPFQTANVTQGMASVPTPSPDLVAGALFDIRTRGSLGDVKLFAYSEFTHAVNQNERQLGTISIDMDAYREVLLRVRDVTGREVRGGVVGLVRFTQEGGIDVKLDEQGEANILLPPGIYGTRGGRFEVGKVETKQIIEVVVPERRSNSADGNR